MIEKNNFFSFLMDNHPESIDYLVINNEKVAIFESKQSPVGKNGEIAIFYFDKFNFPRKNVDSIAINGVYKIIISF